MTAKKLKNVVVATIFILTILSSGLLIALLLQTTSKAKELNACVTKECTVAAASIISTMDETQDPCTDFYSYVCAKFKDKNPELSGLFDETRKQLQIEIQKIMELPNSPNDTSAVKKARQAYQICLNTNTIENKKLARNSLKAFVQHLDGWPMAVGSSWLPRTNSSIEDLLAKLEYIGYSGYVLGLGIEPDPNNPDVKLITLDQPDDDDDDYFIGSRKKKDDEYDDQKTMEQIKIVAQTLWNNNDTDQITKEINELIQLTANLKKIVSPEKNRTNRTRLCNKMSIKQLHEITNNTFNWLSFLQLIFGNDTVNENVAINVMEVEYMQKMPLILANYSRRTVTNFALWNVISDLIEYLPDKANSQETHDLSKWVETCLGDISKRLTFAMWRIYADNVLTNKTMEHAHELTRNIFQAYREMIENSKWLDRETRDNALKKLNAIVPLVGYPQWVVNDAQLNTYYEDFTITTNHFTNMVTADGWSMKKFIHSLHKPVDRNEWPEDTTVLTANAFYIVEANAINIPGGILKPPFYNPNVSQALNYGSLGAIIGHEIGHAFDNEGSQMDDKGGLHEWWTELSQQIYTRRSECFKNQYDAYCYNDTQLEAATNSTCVDGGLTLGENLADNTGLQCAYIAYKHWFKTHEDKPLVGLAEFNPEQLFFVSYAYSCCEHMTSKLWFANYGEDTHSPGKYRVQGPMSNYRPFTETFQCKLGPMNRGHSSCNLW